jgi:hypothetical protein
VSKIWFPAPRIRLMKRPIHYAECYMGLGPPIEMKVPRTRHSERSEESVFAFAFRSRFLAAALLGMTRVTGSGDFRRSATWDSGRPLRRKSPTCHSDEVAAPAGICLSSSSAQRQMFSRSPRRSSRNHRVGRCPVRGLRRKGKWLGDTFCMLFLTVVLWNLAHHIFNLNGDGWQQTALAVNLEQK